MLPKRLDDLDCLKTQLCPEKVGHSQGWSKQRVGRFQTVKELGSGEARVSTKGKQLLALFHAECRIAQGPSCLGVF